MLDTIRRHSNRITLCLLALCGAVLICIALKHVPSRRRPTMVANRKAIWRPDMTAYRSYQQGLVALQDRNETAAEQDFRRSVQEDKDNPMTWLALAELLRKQGKSEVAIGCYRMALNPHPEWNSQRLAYWHMSGQVDPEGALHYAQLCASLGYTQEADTAYKGVIEAVEYKHFRTLQGVEWEAASTLKKRAYLAIAFWRDNQNRHAEAVPAYAIAGVPNSR